MADEKPNAADRRRPLRLAGAAGGDAAGTGGQDRPVWPPGPPPPIHGSPNGMTSATTCPDDPDTILSITVISRQRDGDQAPFQLRALDGVAWERKQERIRRHLVAGTIPAQMI